MFIERLTASGQAVGSLVAGRDTPRPPLRPALHPRAVSALLAPAAMAVGAVGLACLWGALPRPAAQWSAQAPDGAFHAISPATGPVAAAALRQSTAMAQLLSDLGAVQVAAPAPAALPQGPSASLDRLRDAEADMIATADRSARAEIDAERRLFRTAGLDPRPYSAAEPAKALSPLELRHPRVLGARLDIGAGLARRLQRTAQDLVAARAPQTAAAALPLAYPVDDPQVSSPFGVRLDPFQGEAAFHPGMDFPGRYGQPIHATAPGIVSFVGQRSGYGNCIEVDHGHGLKTRYGHLSGFAARVGDSVGVGDTIARMGSTGRSTGVHVHYEVWANNRLQNPARFLKAGDARS